MATTVTVEGTLRDAEGANLSGTIKFRPSSPFYDLAGNLIVGTAPVTATLASGEFSQTLYATDDATTSAADATYTITETLTGADGSAIRRTYKAAIPSASATARYEDLVEVESVEWNSYATTAALADLESRLGGTSAVSAGDTTVPRNAPLVDTVPTVSGTLLLSYFTASRSEEINRVAVVVGDTGAGATPTLVRLGLYSVDASTGALTLVTSASSDTGALDTSATVISWQVTAYDVVAEQRYAVGLLVVTGAATPTMVGVVSDLPGSELAVAPRMTATVSGQTDLPASIETASLGDTSLQLYARTHYEAPL